MKKIKRPSTPGMYKFTQTEPGGLPFSEGDWVVGIVFRRENFYGDGKNHWCFYGHAGNKKHAHGFSWGLADFVGKGIFERI